jgi:hypothetical protein
MDLEEEEEDEPEPVPKWTGIVGRALVPWDESSESEERESEWKRTWRDAVGKVLEDEQVKKGMERLSWMCSDVRQVLKIFVSLMRSSPRFVASIETDFLLADSTHTRPHTRFTPPHSCKDHRFVRRTSGRDRVGKGHEEAGRSVARFRFSRVSSRILAFSADPPPLNLLTPC